MRFSCVACSLTLALAAITGCSSGRPEGVDGGESPYDAAPFTSGISTLAGAAEAAYFDGDRPSGRFADPVNVAYGPDGKLYVADFNNSRIRIVDSEGNSSTLVDQKNFVRPYGLLFLDNGKLLVETDNDPTGGHSLMSGTLWTVDTGTGAATVLAADLGRPRGLAKLPSGLVAMSDEFHHVIRTIDPTNGAIATLAGSWDQKGMQDGPGADARFSTPYGITVAADGSLVVCDFDNSRLRRVAADGSVSTMTGSTSGFADGTMSAAQFDHPQAIVSAPNGDMFVTDIANYRVRRISGDAVTTVAGDGKAGYADADDPTQGEIFGLEGLALSSDATMLYLADGDRGDDVPYNRIRQVKLP